MRSIAIVSGPGLLAAAATVALAGCGKVGKDEFNETVAQIRTELDAQDGRITANEQAIGTLRSDVDGLRTSLDQLRNDFQVKIEELENGLRFATPVHFEFDDASIRSADRPLLDRFASVVKRYYPGATVTVEGFADPAGTAAYNNELSSDRANNVRDYLVNSAGLSAETVKTVGYGENRQVRPGEQGPGERGWENRRVTFVIEHAGSQAEATEMTTTSAVPSPASDGVSES